MMMKNTSIVLNYPTKCPECDGSIIPVIPMKSTTTKDVAFFQCTNSSCKHTFAKKLIKTDELNHLFVLASGVIPVGMVLLGAYPEEAIRLDLVDRFNKLFGEGTWAMFTIDQLLANGAAWLEKINETNAVVEMAVSPELSEKIDGYDEKGIIPSKAPIQRAVEEAHALLDSGVKYADFGKLTDLSNIDKDKEK